MVLSFQLKQETEKVNNKSKEKKDFDSEEYLLVALVVKTTAYNTTDEYCQMASVWGRKIHLMYYIHMSDGLGLGGHLMYYIYN